VRDSISEVFGANRQPSKHKSAGQVTQAKTQFHSIYSSSLPSEEKSVVILRQIRCNLSGLRRDCWREISDGMTADLQALEQLPWLVTISIREEEILDNHRLR